MHERALMRSAGESGFSALVSRPPHVLLEANVARWKTGPARARWLGAATGAVDVYARGGWRSRGRDTRHSRSRALRLLAAAGVALAGRELLGHLREADLRGQVALITGGSRGLGLLLARELA